MKIPKELLQDVFNIILRHKEPRYSRIRDDIKKKLGLTLDCSTVKYHYLKLNHQNFIRRLQEENEQMQKWNTFATEQPKEEVELDEMFDLAKTRGYLNELES